jgi:hypothetical protein
MKAALAAELSVAVKFSRKIEKRLKDFEVEQLKVLLPISPRVLLEYAQNIHSSAEKNRNERGG